MRGQLSVEFLIVVSSLLIIVAAITMPMYNRARFEAEKVSKIADAREAANLIANALNSLYASGPGSRQTVEYWLPKGVVEIWATVDDDGIETSDVKIPPNGCLDVQILLDLDGDGDWDNKREAVVLVDTILPSAWHENGDGRDENWVYENCVHVQDWRFTLNPALRTRHKTTFEYRRDPVDVSGVTLKRVRLGAGEKFRLRTRLFGVKLRIDAKNKDGVIEVKFKLGKQKLKGEGTEFTLTLTEGDVRVDVVVSGGWIEVKYWVTLVKPIYRSQITVSDVITGSV